VGHFWRAKPGKFSRVPKFSGVHEDESGLWCRVRAYNSTRFEYHVGLPYEWEADIDVCLEDLGGPLVWQMGRIFDAGSPGGRPCPRPPAAVIEQTEVAVRREVRILLLRIEALIKEARIKKLCSGELSVMRHDLPQ